MKVPESNRTNVTNPASVSTMRNRAVPHAAKQTADAGAAGGDQVEVSSLGSLLNTLASQSASHAAKIHKLSSAVAAGHYRVDPQAVSDKLIQEHLRPAA